MGMDMSREVAYPRPDEYAGALTLPFQNAAVPTPKIETSVQAGPVGLFQAVRNHEMTPLAMAEVMMMIVMVMGMIARRLMTSGERMSAIVRGESSWIAEDTFENRMAFERRFGKASS